MKFPTTEEKLNTLIGWLVKYKGCPAQVVGYPCGQYCRYHSIERAKLAASCWEAFTEDWFSHLQKEKEIDTQN